VNFGASTVAFRDPAWDERLDEFVEAGCECLELTAAFGPGAREGAAFDYMDPLAVERAGRAIDRSGLRLHSMHGPMMLLPPSRRSPFGRAGLEGLLEAERAACDTMMAMGGRFVVTQDVAELEPEDAPHLASRSALSELADYAAERGCVFCIENGAEDIGAFGRLVDLARGLEHPGLGICLDTGHAQIWNYLDVPRAILACGSALRSCHLHDNTGSSDGHLVPGEGILPWRAVLDALAEVAYRGPLVIEVHSEERRRDPGAEVRASMEFLASVGRDLPGAVATVEGLKVFGAGEADRERASLVMGRDRVPAQPEGDAGAALVATDRFGEPAAWASLARNRDDSGEASLAISFRRAENPEVARVMARMLVESDDETCERAVGAVRAEGAAADALLGMGYQCRPDGRFVRPGAA